MGLNALGRSGLGVWSGPPTRKPVPVAESPVVEDVCDAAEAREKKSFPWGKLALGVGAGLGVAAAAYSPVGAAIVQESHLAQCVGLSDPVELIDLSLNTAVPQGFPAADATPGTNTSWWNGLSAQKQQDYLANAPAALGRMDGLPTSVRDEANRAVLKSDMAALQSEKAQLQKEVDAQGSDVGSTLSDKLPGIRLKAVSERLTDLKRLDDVINASDNRYLLLLDNVGDERAQAAVSLGNPDTADNVAVAVGGVNSTVRSLGGMVGEAEELQKVAHGMLDEAGRSDEAIASVAWLGYNPPQFEGNFCQKVRGGLESAGEGNAQQGADSLNRFYKGLQAARSSDTDPNVTAIGHSYGSLTTSLALQEGGHGVDNLVVYGSPGLDLGWYSQLGLQPGHAYEMTAVGDHVPEYVGKARWFGTPTKENPDFVHMRTEATTIDGVTYEGVHAHSEYPRSGDNGNVRISGYNVAGVVAGLPENVVTVG